MNDQPLFDYSSIMIQMEQLNKAIHKCLLHEDTAQAETLADELLVQTRFLRLWIKQELEKKQ